MYLSKRILDMFDKIYKDEKDREFWKELYKDDLDIEDVKYSIYGKGNTIYDNMHLIIIHTKHDINSGTIYFNCNDESIKVEVCKYIKNHDKELTEFHAWPHTITFTRSKDDKILMMFTIQIFKENNLDLFAKWCKEFSKWEVNEVTIEY